MPRLIRTPRSLVGAAAAAALTAGLLTPTGAGAAPDRVEANAAAATSSVATTSRWTARPEQWAEVVTTKDHALEMSDGVTLYGDLTRPARANGSPVTRRLPVIVTITAYNKTVIAGGAGATLAGADPAYLVKRGYAQLTVDARGTGSSEGQWGAFSARENKDAGEIVEWAASQPWSNGKVGMTGASYMGISQLFAAGHQPEGLKAIFPQVPAADVYRDVVASGGQIDVGFIPLWLGLVTGTGLVPPAADPGVGTVSWLVDRLLTATTFTGPLMLDAISGGNAAYDGAFYRTRSPINVLDDVTVPTFLIGGQDDLFQRGTPLVYEKLRRNGAPTRMILGPWDHLQGSSGAEVVDAGHGTLAELQLRWFDKWIKGQRTHLGEIPKMTYFEKGSGRWRAGDRWIGRDLSARTLKLSGTATMGGDAGGLRNRKPRSGESTLVPLPVTGLCTRSLNQWTAGILATAWAENPCFHDNGLNDLAGLSFETAPLSRPIRTQGPMNAKLFVSTTAGDGLLGVTVEDVAPDGTATYLTGGWQTIAHRALDRRRSRFLDGQLIQPYHPFTKGAKRPLSAGTVAPVDVEIFPTAAKVKKGHRIRVTVQGYDVPHLLPTLPDLVGHALPTTLHTGKGTNSRLILPVR